MSTLFDLGTTKAAIISPCGLYRYRLTRRWNDDGIVNWVMLNPSKADAEIDDNTIRRCIGFSRSWGYGGLVVTNLFGFRSTDPKGLLSAVDPIGPENGRYVRMEAMGADRVVCAWGEPPKKLADRAEAVLTQLWSDGLELYCLTRTVSGQPGHPLRLASDLVPRAMKRLDPGRPSP